MVRSLCAVFGESHNAEMYHSAVVLDTPWGARVPGAPRGHLLRHATQKFATGHTRALQAHNERVVRGVGAVVFDDAGRLLVIRRGRPPHEGRWSVPGGHVEPDEDDETAVVREVAEETGLRVRPVSFLGTIEVTGARGTVEVRDYRCELLGGVMAPGDDASEAAWVTRAELDALATTPRLIELLTAWNALPTS
jgi:8-oxo-dGTP diphosphatase